MANQVMETFRAFIENPQLRRQIGKAGQWEVEQGKYSVRRSNQKLSTILDKAIGGKG